jgi:hypothetical protein
MRTVVILALIFLLWPMVTSVAQPGSSGRTAIYFAPNVERTVVLTKQGVALGSFQVPAGTLLSIGYPAEGSQLPDATERFTAHGDVEIRVQAMRLKDQTANLETAMRQAPVVLSAKDVDVVVSH